jgi:hypothetical protein
MPTMRQARSASEWVEAPRRRRGISLIEVLMSIFIVSVGLLGVLSLVPVGHLEAQKGSAADRAAVIGEYAMRDFRIRGLHHQDPRQVDPNSIKYLSDKTEWHHFGPFRSQDEPRYVWISSLSKQPVNVTLARGGTGGGGGAAVGGQANDIRRLKVHVFFLPKADVFEADPGNDENNKPIESEPIAEYERVVRIDNSSPWQMEVPGQP